KQPAQLAGLRQGECLLGGRITQNLPQAQLHGIQLDRTSELLMERVKNLALRRLQEMIVTVQQLVDDLAAMMLVTDDRMPQGLVCLAIGIFDPSEVRKQTGCETVDFSNALLCTRPF